MPKSEYFVTVKVESGLVDYAIERAFKKYGLSGKPSPEGLIRVAEEIAQRMVETATEFPEDFEDVLMDAVEEAL